MAKFLICLLAVTAIVTQAFSQTIWTKHPENPVLKRGSSDSWDDELVANLYTMFDGSRYHGWYSGFDGNGTNIGYVSSTDGISWTKHSAPVLNNGSGGNWDDFVVYQPSVFFDGEAYHMWFGGHNGPTNRQIGYATSPDSINWTKHHGNPVLKPGDNGSWDDQWVDSPFVLKIDSVYHMWYSGYDGAIMQSGHATSVDGINWEKDSLNPVLKVGISDEWDTQSAYQPSVLIDQDSKYHMFYSGGKSFEWNVGYASSLDGRNWTKYHKPVMEPGITGSWDDTYTGLFTVAFNEDSSVFKMWYTGDNVNSFMGGEIGYATSPLESHPLENKWYKHLDNPVFSGKKGTWDANFVSGPTVVVYENKYYMWYSGYDGVATGSGTGYAYSDDGINWERHPDPVLQTGSSGSWDALTVFQPSVLYDGSTYHMWFCGHNGILTRQIGYATSEDLINWTKHGSNPVLKPGSSGSWDDQWVDSPEVLYIDGAFHIWYAGNDGTNTQVGHAKSPDGVTWEKDPLNPVLTIGSSGKWDDLTVGAPSVLYDGHTFHLWYGGGQNFAWDWKTGYAYSKDGSTWIKVSVDNPVMDLGKEGEWDDKFIVAGGAEIVIEDTTLKMWYGGGDDDVMGQIGFAQSDIPSDIKDILLKQIPLRPSLSQNYPNPFNPSTFIEFTLVQSEFVELNVYNVLGEKVQSLVSNKLYPGNHSYQFDGRNLASGVYYYQFVAGDFRQVKKMILLK